MSEDFKLGDIVKCFNPKTGIPEFHELECECHGKDDWKSTNNIYLVTEYLTLVCRAENREDLKDK